MADVRIGISGWTYAPWRGTFFPGGLAQREELHYASRQLATIEINGTFYSLQKPASYARWASEVPDDFVFSVKAPRYITHVRRLEEVAVPVANFLASGLLRLGSKLGPILWQLPPSLHYDRRLLESFLALLPPDSASAAKMARRHDEKVTEAWLKAGPLRPWRHAIEVRHESFATPEFIGLLRDHNVAIVVADTAGKWPVIEDVTADFVYARLHGDSELYVSGYTPKALGIWAAKIRAWSAGRNGPGARLVTKNRPAPQARAVYVYFDNDVKTRSPYDAMSLAHLLGRGPAPGEAPSIAPTAELPRTHWPSYRRRRSGGETGRTGPRPSGPKGQ
jgi:uncharacterized protein YecE (DUF72 family)